MDLFYSIIIPVAAINDYINETCKKLKELKNNNFEILIFPDNITADNKVLEKQLNARIIPSGKVSPAIKRDMAIEHAKGNIFAFLDDDAYPENNWLDIADKYLCQDDDIAAIGGSQLTPSDDSFSQKVSGAMFLSPLSGKTLIRYWPGNKVIETDDWPSVNILIKKEDFVKVGGFDSHYWPGEDTKLCLDITHKLKKKILYIPNLIVYHHRRSGLRKHIKQIGNYGLHRGFFAKEHPETSRRLFYFVPSLFDLFLLIGIILSFYNDICSYIFLTGLSIYTIAVLFSTIFVWKRIRNIPISLSTIPYLVLTHLWYGIRFIQGFLFTKKLKSKLGK
jgi:GT2 family glycosyltransferase